MSQTTDQVAVPPSWTEERVNTLTTMWVDGYSAAQIAAVVQTTRNAVIGKVHRLKLAKRERARPPVASARPKNGATGQKRFVDADGVSKLTPMSVEPPQPVPGGVPLVELEHHHCRAVIGLGPDGLARYCGAQKEGSIRIRSNSAYCITHGNLYYHRVPAE